MLIDIIARMLLQLFLFSDGLLSYYHTFFNLNWKYKDVISPKHKNLIDLN